MLVMAMDRTIFPSDVNVISTQQLWAKEVHYQKEL